MIRSVVFLLLWLPLGVHAQMRIIPHLTRAGGDFVSRISLDNPTLGETAYQLAGYDEAGGELGTVTGMLPPRTNRELDPFVLFG